MKRLAAAACVVGLLSACFGPDPSLTEAGKGKPVLGLDFPETLAAGATATAMLTVENPGPGDMSSLVVAFASVGAPAAEGSLPADLVPVTTSSENPAIASITPEPNDISPDGVVYVFDGIAEGSSVEISFEIVAPDDRGRFANSVSVYDGQETDRVAGLRLETLVTG